MGLPMSEYYSSMTRLERSRLINEIADHQPVCTLDKSRARAVGIPFFIPTWYTRPQLLLEPCLQRATDKFDNPHRHSNLPASPPICAG